MDSYLGVEAFGKLIYVIQLTCIRADFWEGDATKHFSVKEKGFSVKRGEAIQRIRGLVKTSTGKAIQ